MKLFVADIHIKLGQKNVPISWQRNRFLQLANIIKGYNADEVIIGGDLLDVANPSIEEVGLMYEFLKAIDTPMILIPGNHEMTTGTLDCYSLVSKLLTDLNVRVVREFETIDDIDYIPYNIIKKPKLWKTTDSKWAVTHVRGEIPPHVTPEIDLSLLSNYEVVFAGDLHSRKNSQGNIQYPGSPMVTSFHRNRVSGTTGIFLIHDEHFEWVELDLPQLIRKKVSKEEDMVATYPDHTIYELEGSMEELRKVKKSDLLDKRVATNISTPATLNMTGNITDEVAEYLSVVKGVPDVEGYIAILKDITNYEQSND